MNKLGGAYGMNKFEEAQSNLIQELTSFSRYINTGKTSSNEIKKRARKILFSMEEVGGFYEVLEKHEFV